jgi:hypothetical protein
MQMQTSKLRDPASAERMELSKLVFCEPFRIAVPYEHEKQQQKQKQQHFIIPLEK